MNNKRYAKNSIILGIIAFIYLMIFAVVCARADYEHGLPKVYNMPMTDIDKPVGDLYKDTCASAALANAISFSLGYDLTKAQKLYNFFIKITKYQPVSMIELWDLWMDAGKLPCGYGRYANFSAMGYVSGYHYIETITGMMDAGNVILLPFFQGEGNPAHVVTVYGYRINDDGTTLLYYVDSDDGKDKLYAGELTYIENDTYFKTYDGFRKVAGWTAVRVLAPWSK